MKRSTVECRSATLLRELRHLKGWTLRDVEERLAGYCGKSMLQALESGEKRTCSLRVGRRIEEVYGQPAGLLFLSKVSTEPHTVTTARGAA